MFKSGLRKLLRSLCFQCDEVYPICSNCKRLGSSCSLSNSNSPTDDEVVEKQLNIEDLQLIHDWHMGNDTKFADHLEEESFRQQRGKEIDLGFKHPYVLHMILAIAALHMTTTSSDKSKWYALAISHHGASVRLARPHIAASSSTHMEAIFNFSGFNSLFTLAEPAIRSSANSSCGARDYVGDILGAFRMSRGIRAIIAKNPGLLAQMGLTNNAGWSYDTSSIELTLAERFPQLQSLKNLVMQHVGDAEKRSSALKSVHSLFLHAATLDESPKDHSSASLILRWAVEADTEFIDFCDSRHPVALVILAYYATVMNRRANIWFFRPWPRLLLDDIIKELQGSQWASWIEDPVREIGQSLEDPFISEKD